MIYNYIMYMYVCVRVSGGDATPYHRYREHILPRVWTETQFRTTDCPPLFFLFWLETGEEGVMALEAYLVHQKEKIHNAFEARHFLQPSGVYFSLSLSLSLSLSCSLSRSLSLSLHL